MNTRNIACVVQSRLRYVNTLNEHAWCNHDIQFIQIHTNCGFKLARVFRVYVWIRLSDTPWLLSSSLKRGGILRFIVIALLATLIGRLLPGLLLATSSSTSRMLNSLTSGLLGGAGGFVGIWGSWNVASIGFFGDISSSSILRLACSFLSLYTNDVNKRHEITLTEFLYCSSVPSVLAMRNV